MLTSKIQTEGRRLLDALFDDMCPHSLFLYSPQFQRLDELRSFIGCECILVFVSAPLCCASGHWWFCCGHGNDGDYCNGVFDDFVELDHFALFLRGGDLPLTKKTLIAVLFGHQ